MPKHSAGLLLYRRAAGTVEVFLVHPGGPFWANRDDGAWSIPKGEFDPNEDPLDAAKREFREETGLTEKGEYLPLKPIRQKGGKIVHAWAVQCDIDAAAVRSNSFSMAWPSGSGNVREFPEIDRGEWFKIETAKQKILKSQMGLLEQLQESIASHS
jgi:predicted NUDIX family NTP pyrophosphohydrolase